MKVECLLTRESRFRIPDEAKGEVFPAETKKGQVLSRHLDPK